MVNAEANAHEDSPDNDNNLFTKRVTALRLRKLIQLLVYNDKSGTCCLCPLDYSIGYELLAGHYHSQQICRDMY